jgi:probable rRNA maturation factor
VTLVTGTAELTVLCAAVPGGRRRLEKDLARLADHVARRAGRDAVLSFVVMDDARIREVNRKSLAHDHATDVLSFPLEDRPALVGEVLVSAQTARREAARRGHAPYHELMLYAVHGVLHLLGHDDHRPRDRARMRRSERALLRSLGIGPVFASRAGGTR